MEANTKRIHEHSVVTLIVNPMIKRSVVCVSIVSVFFRLLLNAKTAYLQYYYLDSRPSMWASSHQCFGVQRFDPKQLGLWASCHLNGSKTI